MNSITINVYCFGCGKPVETWATETDMLVHAVPCVDCYPEYGEPAGRQQILLVASSLGKPLTLNHNEEFDFQVEYDD